MRLNFSHGNHEEKALLIKHLRAVEGQARIRMLADPQLMRQGFENGALGNFCAIAADTKARSDCMHS